MNHPRRSRRVPVATGTAPARGPWARRGTTIVYAYVISLVGLTVGTLAVDYGHAQAVKTQMQRCADVTARGCVENYLRKGLSTAQSLGPSLATANPVDSGSGYTPTTTITWGYWDSVNSAFVAGSGNPVAVKVDVSRTAANGNQVPVLLPVFTGYTKSGSFGCDISTSAIAVANTRLLFDYSQGFGGASPTPTPTLVNSAAIAGNNLRITPATGNKNGAAWSAKKVSVGCFTTAFTFQFTSATADGICFVMQNQSPTAMGTVGIDLGYGGITKSFCIKFDIYNNSGEGTNSTGLFSNGARPTVPAIDLTPSGIVMRNGHAYNVVISYDGTTLIWTITDATNALFTMTNSSVVNIPSIIGGSTAYVGFVGSTGGSYAQQDILTWTYSIAVPRLMR